MINHLSNILIETFGVPFEEVKSAQRTQRVKGGRTEEILIQKKSITENQLLEALSVLYDIPFWPDLPLENISPDCTRYVPIHFLKKYTMVPLENHFRASSKKERVDHQENAERKVNPHRPDHIIAIYNPAWFQPVDDLARILGIKNYEIVLSKKSAILTAINISYDLSRDSAEQLVQDMEENDSTIIGQIEGAADLLDDTTDAPIIKLVNHIISQSIKARASDIHIEPFQDSFKVRYRVDGILYNLITPPNWIQPALTSRIKVMAKMDIAEKRLPQDGRFEVKVGDQDIDIRVATIPTSFGERVVLRLLNKSGALLKLSELGLKSGKLKLIQDLIQFTNGVILVTGPTGSGKTTTLYAVLLSINTPDINIITIEDPVEYQIKGIGQIQVNPKIDLTFARGLRSIVRQDPDVILVGEIRDKETAEIAVQSALTGHLVFSTLHTNDSASAITRLVDIGVEPFLISSSVKAVVAQRLIRVLCEDCKELYTPDETALKSIGMIFDQIKTGRIYKAKGCPNCFHTGYKGRIGIFEIMVLDSDLATLILKTYDSNRIKTEALNKGTVSLRHDGIEKVLMGITTIEEVLRVTQK
ncbi:MAG: type II secretion system ATPase GspE [Desulfobacterales bacterium]|nr:type II secretion system ATPase GspE [Desulfobacterales bacterium]